MAHGNAHLSSFFISVPGASAGGLEAFEHFFKHVPAEAGIPGGIAPHLAPAHPLAELMTCATRPGLMNDRAISIHCLDEPAPDRLSFSGNGIGLTEESEYGQEATFNLRIPA
jgi:hypothetical protein